MMDDLFASAAAPSVARTALVVPINNDIVLARFRVAGGPEQAAHGRVAQMLATLASRGTAGVTSAQFTAGTRVSDSIHKLRHRHRLVIKTERVGHSGIFAGEHAIYRLSSPIDVIELVRAEAMRARRSEGAAMQRNPSAIVEDSTAADRERLKGILHLARHHVTALRLVLGAFDNRLRAERRRRQGGRHASAS